MSAIVGHEKLLAGGRTVCPGLAESSLWAETCEG